MKLSVLIILFTVTQVSAAKVFSQTITASFERAELRTILNVIEKRRKCGLCIITTSTCFIAKSILR
ncbi:hypothetical protein MKQ70_01595 [Chitinophaga sedimenti]|uniref:hypothetical protein n=1 Tax=Chitinophaga sedimenti TaxID=2033606 RepID=UPI002006CD4D|nr:hypothetical protein [Chitinophaga sedimenti]MCK7553764.1 hypothetical protein [Chitinophaga sedimenti]